MSEVLIALLAILLLAGLVEVAIHVIRFLRKRYISARNARLIRKMVALEDGRRAVQKKMRQNRLGLHMLTTYSLDNSGYQEAVDVLRKHQELLEKENKEVFQKIRKDRKRKIV